MGKTVACYDKYSRGSKDYYTLSKEIILAEKLGASTEPQQPTIKIEKPQTPTISIRDEEMAREETVEQDSLRTLSKKMKEIVTQETKEIKALFSTKFLYDASGAKSVFVTGSFNDWSLDDTCRMSEGTGGSWNAEIDLKPGLYKYQFIVDGVWKEDPSNPRKERNSFGDINSLIEVAADEQAAAS